MAQTKEIHTIRKFRGSNLGIIRLNNLAYPDEKKVKILINGIEIKPVAFDTYGHPIISESNFIYYQAIKANADRRAETFLTEVFYDEIPFCISRRTYDAKEVISNAASMEDLNELKQLLEQRKRAAFLKKELNEFILFGKYVLAKNGHIYLLNEIFKNSDIVVEIDDHSKYSWTEEVHIPGPNDVCAICGEKFSIKDVEEGRITENEKVEKVHCNCQKNFIKAVELQTASQIIDAVYDGKPAVSVREEWDEEDNKLKVWYEFKTIHGTISIRFKRKVIVLEWHNNFKPFNMSIFDNERVTKYDRGIHAWSKDAAIQYLMKAKNA